MKKPGPVVPGLSGQVNKDLLNKLLTCAVASEWPERSSGWSHTGAEQWRSSSWSHTGAEQRLEPHRGRQHWHHTGAEQRLETTPGPTALEPHRSGAAAGATLETMALEPHWDCKQLRASSRPTHQWGMWFSADVYEWPFYCVHTLCVNPMHW